MVMLSHYIPHSYHGEAVIFLYSFRFKFDWLTWNVLQMAENREQTIFEQHPSALNAVNHFQVLVKRGRWKKLDFAYSFLPVYYFSRVLGLLPYSFMCDSEGELQAPQVDLIDGIWFLLSMFIYVLAAFTNYQMIKMPKQIAISSPLYFGHYTLLIQGLLICAISIAMDMFNRKKFVTVLKTFIDFDKEVKDGSIQIRCVLCWLCIKISIADGQCWIFHWLSQRVPSSIVLFVDNIKRLPVFYVDYILSQRYYRGQFFNTRSVALFRVVYSERLCNNRSLCVFHRFVIESI